MTLRQRVDGGEVAQEAAIDRPGGARDEMGLVDQHEVDMLDVVGTPVDRLDAGEEDACLCLAAAEPGAVDAGRRLGPEAEELGVVLADQLAHMGEDEDALVRPGLEDFPDERRHDQRLAAGRRDDDERVAVGLAEVAVDRVDGLALIGTEGEAHAAALGPSRQTPPSARR